MQAAEATSSTARVDLAGTRTVRSSTFKRPKGTRTVVHARAEARVVILRSKMYFKNYIIIMSSRCHPKGPTESKEESTRLCA